MTIPILDALELADLRWRLLPVRPDDKRPVASLVPHGRLDATDDLATVAGRCRAAPWANLAVAMVESGLVGLDVDFRRGGDDDLHELEERLAPLPTTVESHTGGGGLHLIFRHPGGPMRAELAPGVEVKSSHYLVLPPSVHGNGKPYTWACDQSPLDLAPAKLPARWRAAMATPVAAARSPFDPDDPLAAIPAGVYLHVLTGRTPRPSGAVLCPLHDGGRERHPSMRTYATGWACWACPAPHGASGVAGGGIYQFAARLWNYGLPLRGRAFNFVRARLLDTFDGGRTA